MEKLFVSQNSYSNIREIHVHKNYFYIKKGSFYVELWFTYPYYSDLNFINDIKSYNCNEHL